MSTRACYIFRDSEKDIAVYKHSDGDPEGAYQAIFKSLALAWPLPRFEADEFAAAFVAANKTTRGEVRLINNSKGTWKGFPVDIEYVYLVKSIGDQLEVKVWTVYYDFEKSRWKKKSLTGWIIQET